MTACNHPDNSLALRRISAAGAFVTVLTVLTWCAASDAQDRTRVPTHDIPASRAFVTESRLLFAGGQDEDLFVLSRGNRPVDRAGKGHSDRMRAKPQASPLMPVVDEHEGLPLPKPSPPRDILRPMGLFGWTYDMRRQATLSFRYEDARIGERFSGLQPDYPRLLAGRAKSAALPITPQAPDFKAYESWVAEQLGL